MLMSDFFNFITLWQGNRVESEELDSQPDTAEVIKFLRFENELDKLGRLICDSIIITIILYYSLLYIILYIIYYIVSL